MGEIGNRFHGGDFNGNGKYDPGDRDIYREIIGKPDNSRGQNGIEKHSSNSIRAGTFIGIVITLIMALSFGNTGFLICLVGWYLFWLCSR